MTATPIEDAGEISKMGAPALRRAFAARTLSPVEVAQACIGNAERANPVFNAFTFLDHDGALAAARASEARWRRGEPQSPVDGVPGTLKDIVWVKGWTVRYGSRTTSDTAYLEDAPSVAMMREKGVVFLGQTTTPEFGWKAVTDSALTGVTRNAWDASKTSGGSSGGAAVAAATGAGVFHLGTDGGGSIRVPSSFNGIVGLKPTFGRVAAYPASAFGTVAHIGPMARRVSDAAAMLEAMAGRSDKDWAQGPGLLAPLGPVEGALVNARIGYWREPPCGKLDPEVGAAVDNAAKRLEAFGARVEPIVLPGSDHLAIFNTIWFSGAAAEARSGPAEQTGPDRAGLSGDGRLGSGLSLCRSCRGAGPSQRVRRRDGPAACALRFRHFARDRNSGFWRRPRTARFQLRLGAVDRVGGLQFPDQS